MSEDPNVEELLDNLSRRTNSPNGVNWPMLIAYVLDRARSLRREPMLMKPDQRAEVKDHCDRHLDWALAYEQARAVILIFAQPPSPTVSEDLDAIIRGDPNSPILPRRHMLHRRSQGS